MAVGRTCVPVRRKIYNNNNNKKRHAASSTALYRADLATVSLVGNVTAKLHSGSVSTIPNQSACETIDPIPAQGPSQTSAAIFYSVAAMMKNPPSLHFSWMAVIAVPGARENSIAPSVSRVIWSWTISDHLIQKAHYNTNRV
ncbi:hypothetical protein CDV31_017193 [Fusarium ambrosium]|uniref:Uncharacterized protein n=1 Tax=Fusarium ambrosium TaxID=131363 RepID=A0A428RQB9_9HYPO|nr:hypothetical protein CDV31_017193 [Fusarium ambrosium]